MKLAAPFVKDTRWIDIPDEYNIDYSKTSSLQRLLDFFETFPDTRINIRFTTEEIPIDILKSVNKIYFENLYVRVTPPYISYIQQLQENNIKFFFDNSLSCHNLTLLNYMIELGVSDIYPSDDLCYQLPQVSQLCKEHNIGIRLVLNRIPSTVASIGKEYIAPFFSPRDMKELEKYITTAEFDCSFRTEYYDWHSFNVYYKNYFIKQDWNGMLNELNPDVQIEYPVRCMGVNFTERRNRCGRRCLLDSSCDHCKRLIELAQDLYLDGLYVRLRGQKEEK